MKINIDFKSKDNKEIKIGDILRIKGVARDYYYKEQGGEMNIGTTHGCPDHINGVFIVENRNNDIILRIISEWENNDTGLGEKEISVYEFNNKYKKKERKIKILGNIKDYPKYRKEKIRLYHNSYNDYLDAGTFAWKRGFNIKL